MLLYEAERFGENFYLEHSVHRNFSFPVHLHRSFEYTWVTAGQLTVSIDGTEMSLGPGEGVLCLSNVLHGYSSSQSEMQSLVFSPEWVPDFAAAVQKKYAARPVMRLDGLLLQLLGSFQEKLQDAFAVKGTLYLLCSSFLSQVKLIDNSEQDSGELLRQVVFQVQENFKDPGFSLKMAAGALGYDYCYLSRYTAKMLKMPFTHYLAQYRAAYALQLLRDGRQTVAEIAMQSGFSSIRSFNETFKRVTGQTPSEARKTLPPSSPLMG